MAEHLNLYQKATYYDIIFDRDVRREVDFMIAMTQKHLGAAPKVVLDMACGPGYHAREFTRRGIKAIGTDLQPEMIEFARHKDAAENLETEWLVADMRQFTLAYPADLAVIAFDGLDALQDNQDVIQHLRCVAANLNPEGIYLIDLSHPREVNPFYYYPFHYEGERDGTRVEIDWAINNPQYDLITGLATVELEMRVSTATGESFQIRDSAVERLFMPQEIILLAELSGCFNVVGWYGDYDLETTLSAPNAQRMLIILQVKRD